MKKATSAIMAALALAAGEVLAIGASQEWVKDYIARLNGSTNSVITVDAGGTNGEVTCTYELATAYALVATNSVHATVTNGYMFAYTSNGVYRAGTLHGGEEIQATQTNFIWRTQGSVETNGVDTFEGAFGVVGCRVRPSTAEEVLK